MKEKKTSSKEKLPKIEKAGNRSFAEILQIVKSVEKMIKKNPQISQDDGTINGRVF